MSWYRFVNGKGISRLKEYQVGFYDERTGEVYDETYYEPNQANEVMPYLLEPFCKVFAIFSKDEVYEITATRVER